MAGLFVFGEWRGPGARLPLHLACRGYAVANLPGLGCGQAQPRRWHSPAQHMGHAPGPAQHVPSSALHTGAMLT